MAAVARQRWQDDPRVIAMRVEFAIAVQNLATTGKAGPVSPNTKSLHDRLMTDDSYDYQDAFNQYRLAVASRQSAMAAIDASASNAFTKACLKLKYLATNSVENRTISAGPQKLLHLALGE